MNTENNEYDILLKIFRFIRDYSTGTYTLTQVLNELIRHLTRSGYTVKKLPHAEKTNRIILVEGHKYKLIHRDGWSKYDVIRAA